MWARGKNISRRGARKDQIAGTQEWSSAPPAHKLFSAGFKIEENKAYGVFAIRGGFSGSNVSDVWPDTWHRSCSISQGRNIYIFFGPHHAHDFGASWYKYCSIYGCCGCFLSQQGIPSPKINESQHSVIFQKRKAAAAQREQAER
jgi:hypothetical protein